MNTQNDNFNKSSLSYNMKLMNEEATGVYSELKTRKDSPIKKLPGLPTGYRDLDEMTLGFRNSELIVIASSPTHGKSIFALNIALRQAKMGYKVAFFSLEAKSAEIATKLISIESRVNIDKMRLGNVSAEEWARVEKAMRNIPYDFFIDDTCEINLNELTEKIRKLKYENAIDAVFIDCVQLIKSEGIGEKKETEIENIFKSLRSLAREINIPIIAVSQFKYGVNYKKGNRKPEITDLSFSGAIEYIADVIILIFRECCVSWPDKYNPDYNLIRLSANINVVKQRNGSRGEFGVIFIQEFLRFETKAKPPLLDD